jgi:hypothetical protein
MGARNFVWTRVESVDRSNELLFSENPLPAGFRERAIGREQEYTFGYDRDFHIVSQLLSALGAQFTTYRVPATLALIYGSHPLGFIVFARLRPLRESKQTDRSRSVTLLFVHVFRDGKGVVPRCY